MPLEVFGHFCCKTHGFLDYLMNSRVWHKLKCGDHPLEEFWGSNVFGVFGMSLDPLLKTIPCLWCLWNVFGGVWAFLLFVKHKFFSILHDFYMFLANGIGLLGQSVADW